MEQTASARHLFMEALHLLRLPKQRGCGGFLPSRDGEGEANTFVTPEKGHPWDGIQRMARFRLQRTVKTFFKEIVQINYEMQGEGS